MQTPLGESVGLFAWSPCLQQALRVGKLRSQRFKQGRMCPYLLFVTVEERYRVWPRGSACPGSPAYKKNNYL